MSMAVIRYSADSLICTVQEKDGSFRVATQEDMDTLEVGPDLTEREIQLLDE